MSEERIQNPLITLASLSKSFGAYQALNDINLHLLAGEVHCLAGTNGCGKTTLIKVLSGAHAPDQGSQIILDNGQILHGLTPKQARNFGIQVIYQDLSLFPNLSVAENIAFEHNLGGSFTLSSKYKIRHSAKRIIEELQFDLDLDPLVADLSIAQRQQVAICRALVAQARLVIMDEPTASLTRLEVNQLLRTVRYLKQKNICIVFVSHRLDEVLEISDRVTVIRDGNKIGTWLAREVDSQRLSTLMTGVQLDKLIKPPALKQGKKVLEVKELGRKGQYQNVNFDLYEGEILGLCGLLGSGRSELALSLFGMTHADQGIIRLEGQCVQFKNHIEAIKAGISYVSEDRLTLGMIVAQSISDNIVITMLNELRNHFFFLDKQQKTTTTKQVIEQFSVRASDPSLPISTLSGGNQQKIVLAKWVLTNPKILILDSPTVGVDVGAKASIYELIRHLAAQNISIILISDEVGEVYHNCHRILHFRDGTIAGTYGSDEVSEEQLAEIVNA